MIVVVSCTKSNKTDFHNTPLGKCFTHVFDNAESCIFYENTRGLSVCYNEAIEKYKNEKYLIDIMLFVHDDVYIQDAYVHKKLIDGFKQFDILGLAGSSDFNINRSPITWHNSPKNSWSGGVEHPLQPHTSSENNQFYFSSYGPTPKRCVIIDGLFMAFKYDVLLESNVRFDEDFDFDFYDTSICTRAALAGLKIGTTNIFCTHMSHGQGILEPRYKVLEEKFVKKYKGKQKL